MKPRPRCRQFHSVHGLIILVLVLQDIAAQPIPVNIALTTLTPNLPLAMLRTVFPHGLWILVAVYHLRLLFCIGEVLPLEICKALMVLQRITNIYWTLLLCCCLKSGQLSSFSFWVLAFRRLPKMCQSRGEAAKNTPYFPKLMNSQLFEQ